MKEVILRIEETTEKPNDHYSIMMGYSVITNKQTIKLLIDDEQSCCESWGAITSEDDIKQFEGAELLDIKVVDTALNVEKVNKESGYNGEYWEGGIMFINLETSKGLLQFVLYNSHNGYYGHTAKIISEQLNVEETL